MPHIHSTPGQHDLTVSAYVVRTDFDEPRALLHIHRKFGKLLPVGGHVELHETPWQAIAHELLEESGYQLGQLNILQPASRIKKLSLVAQHPYPLSLNTHDVSNGHFHTDIQYGFVTNSEPLLDIEEGESADLRWLTLQEIIDTPSGMIFENTKEVYAFLITEALATWEQVETGSFLLEYPQEYIGKED